MKRLFKSVLPFILLLSVEIFIYYYVRNNDYFRYDSFFFGWGVLWVFFLFFSIRGSGPDGISRGFGFNFKNGAAAANYATMSGTSTGSTQDKTYRFKNIPFMTSINLTYLLLIILNIIGYMLTY